MPLKEKFSVPPNLAMRALGESYASRRGPDFWVQGSVGVILKCASAS